MKTSPLIKEVRQNSLVITLNKPKSLNVIDIDMAIAIYKSLLEQEKNHNELVIIQGQEGLFSVGGDFKFLVNNEDIAIRDKNFHLYFGIACRLFCKLRGSSVPTVSIMNGTTIGIGGTLSCMTKYRIVTENTIFSVPEVHLGITVDAANMSFFSKLERQIGKYLILSGEQLDGEDAKIAGIATHYVDSSCLEELTSNLVKLGGDTDAIEKELSRWSKPCSAGNILTEENIRVIEDCFQYETIEEILGALEKNASKFSKATIQSILRSSPTAAKLTAALASLASKKTFEEAILRGMETLQPLSHLQDPREGFISVVVNKTRPKWHPQRFDEVDLYRDITAKFIERTTAISDSKAFQDYTALLEKVLMSDSWETVAKL